MPGTVLHLMLFNHENTSADISSFVEETEAYSFQFRIKLEEILSTWEWPAQLYRICPTSLAALSVLIPTTLCFTITLQPNRPVGSSIRPTSVLSWGLGTGTLQWESLESSSPSSGSFFSSNSQFKSVTSSDWSPWTLRWKQFFPQSNSLL